MQKLTNDHRYAITTALIRAGLSQNDIDIVLDDVDIILSTRPDSTPNTVTVVQTVDTVEAGSTMIGMVDRRRRS